MALARAELFLPLSQNIKVSPKNFVDLRVVRANAGKIDAITDLLSKSLNLFGDKLYIKHTPTGGQEGRSSHTLCNGP